MSEMSRRDLLTAVASLSLIEPARQLSALTTLTTPAKGLPKYFHGDSSIALAQGTGSLRSVRVPGKDFVFSVHRFSAELSNYFHLTKDYPISRIFETLPLNPIDSRVAAQLISRGSLSFSGNQVSNNGEYVEVEFGDRTLGRMTVAFDEHVSAIVSEPDAETLAFDFRATPVTVLLTGIDPSYRVATNQRLIALQFNPKVVSYLLAEASNPTSLTKIDVDLELSNSIPPPGPPAVAGIQLASLAWPPPVFTILSASNSGTVCKCNCCGTDVCSPPCPDEGTPTARPSADFWVECLWRNGNLVGGSTPGNIFGFSSADAPEAREYIGRTFLLRRAAICDHLPIEAPIGSKELPSAKIQVTQITYKIFAPPGATPKYTTIIFGTFLGAS